MATNCDLFIAAYFYTVIRGILCLTNKNLNDDIIDIFNDHTSRYLDDIFAIDNYEFKKPLSDIYPTRLQ